MGHSHLGQILSNALHATGGFTVAPGATFNAVKVPKERIFILTDVIVFPVVQKPNPSFILRYRIEEGTKTKFQYNTTGTSVNWSQHFTGGIPFKPGSKVNVVSTNFSTATAGFQLLGYFTTP